MEGQLLCLVLAFHGPQARRPCRSHRDQLIVPAKVAGMPERFIAERKFDLEIIEPENQEDEDGLATLEDVEAITLDTFDSWVFGNMSDEEMQKSWLDTVLMHRLRYCGCTTASPTRNWPSSGSQARET